MLALRRIGLGAVAVVCERFRNYCVAQHILANYPYAIIILDWNEIALASVFGGGKAVGAVLSLCGFLVYASTCSMTDGLGTPSTHSPPDTRTPSRRTEMLRGTQTLHMHVNAAMEGLGLVCGHVASVDTIAETLHIDRTDRAPTTVSRFQTPLSGGHTQLKAAFTSGTGAKKTKWRRKHTLNTGSWKTAWAGKS